MFSLGLVVHFSGEQLKSLDDKGRVSIPREYREKLAAAGDERLVVTKNMDGGLTAYPPAEWEKFVKQLEGVPAGTQRTALNRLYLAPKTDCPLDKQGRIPLSRAQRKWLGLGEEDRELVLVGNFCRIDLFSPARYREVVAEDVALIKENVELTNQLDLP